MSSETMEVITSYSPQHNIHGTKVIESTVLRASLRPLHTLKTEKLKKL